MDWGTFILQGALAVLAVVGAVVLLFRTMGSSYGAIILALQAQNSSQQVLINSLAESRAEHLKMVQALQQQVIDAGHKCMEQLMAQDAEIVKLKHRLADLGDRLEATDRVIDQVVEEVPKVVIVPTAPAEPKRDKP